jgi:hypothetical protein
MKYLSKIVVLAVVGWVGSAHASLMDAIDALSPGDQYRVIFVTNETTTATSSDIGVYDAIAQANADAGSVTNPFGLTWQALASTPSVDARDHTNTVPGTGALISIFNTDGQLLAPSYAGLWDGVLDAPIMFDADGMATVNDFVWTGTDSGGAGVVLGSGSAALGSGSSTTVYGRSDITGGNLFGTWVFLGGVPPADTFAIYAVSAVNTVGSTAVPTPGTIVLFGLGLAGLGYSRRKKA